MGTRSLLSATILVVIVLFTELANYLVSAQVYRLREGVGTQTNNVAEYRSLILGLKYALKKGYKHIVVQGDSLLVCNQVCYILKVCLFLVPFIFPLLFSTTLFQC